MVQPVLPFFEFIDRTEDKMSAGCPETHLLRIQKKKRSLLRHTRWIPGFSGSYTRQTGDRAGNGNWYCNVSYSFHKKTRSL